MGDCAVGPLFTCTWGNHFFLIVVSFLYVSLCYYFISFFHVEGVEVWLLGLCLTLFCI